MCAYISDSIHILHYLFLQIGELLEEDDHNYIWPQDKCIGCTAIRLPFSAHLPNIQLPLSDSFQPLQELTESMQSLLGCNFIPALGMLAGLVMGLGYQRIIDFFEFCPTVIATGGLSCGKTTSLTTALSTIGCHKSGMELKINMLLFTFLLLCI